MAFLLVILLFALGFGLVITLLRLSLHGMRRRAARQLAAYFRDAEEIIRWGRPPESWVCSHRRQINKMHQTGKSDRAIQRAGVHAQKACLRKLSLLLNFLENGRFYDSLETKEWMLDALWAVHEQWSTGSWEVLMAPAEQKTAADSQAGAL